MKYWLIFIVLASLLFIAPPTTTYACSCAKSPTTKEAFNQKDAVFSGTVVDIYNPNESSRVQSSEDPVYVLFEVHESWKGVEQTQAIIVTESDSISCGYPFEDGADYLVYASESTEFFKTQLCDRTNPLSASQGDLERLGKGNRDLVQVDYDIQQIVHEGDSVKGDGISTYWFYILPLILVIGAVYGIYKRRISKK